MRSDLPDTTVHPSCDVAWWHRVRDLLEMIRFSHTVFALPFA